MLYQYKYWRYLNAVGDCEVGTTRKACKNCTCGRAEAEEKVQKLGLTAEQLNNPQSACGNVIDVDLFNFKLAGWHIFENITLFSAMFLVM